MLRRYRVSCCNARVKIAFANIFKQVRLFQSRTGNKKQKPPVRKLSPALAFAQLYTLLDIDDRKVRSPQIRILHPLLRRFSVVESNCNQLTELSAGAQRPQQASGVYNVRSWNIDNLFCIRFIYRRPMIK